MTLASSRSNQHFSSCPSTPAGFLGSTTSLPWVKYEVMLYGQIIKTLLDEYRLFDTVPISGVSRVPLTQTFGQQPTIRRKDSSLRKIDWNKKFQQDIELVVMSLISLLAPTDRVPEEQWRSEIGAATFYSYRSVKQITPCVPSYLWNVVAPWLVNRVF